jgi:outer membrane receptor protein involved in Fe transport
MIRRQGMHVTGARLRPCKGLQGAVITAGALAALACAPTWAAGPGAGDAAADQPAAAAAPTETEQQLQEVTVSASAISIAGYEAPTPVNVIGLQQLQTEAQPDIADTIRELPQFGGSSSPNNQINSTLIVAGTAGLDLVSLRNLGQNRTLVLFDGQRVLPSNIRGGVDMSNVPSTLVERVDVVTGGASAVWGSDAVAGVVNMVINKNFNGAQVNVEYGNDWMGPQHSETRVDVTLGTPFAGGRGHIEVSGSYWNAPDAVFGNQQVGNQYQKLINNPACGGGACPAGVPALVHVNNGGLYGFTQGGVINGMTGAGAALNNIQFVGPNGTPALYNVSNVTGGLYATGPSADNELNNQNLLTIPLKNYTAFALGSYDISDNLKASIQLNYGESNSENDTYPNYNDYSIAPNNAYLQQILAQNPGFASAYAAAGSPTLNIGTTDSNNNNGGAYTSLNQLANTLGGTVNRNYRRLERGVFSLDGKIGDNWTWSGYYQGGEVYVNTDAFTNTNLNFQNNAVNAVYVTPANVGASGLPIGSITCASNLLPAGSPGATSNCAPLNILGNGVASPEAIAYIQSSARGGGDQQWSVFKENVVSVSAQGKLPIGLPAGQVATAFGAQYRSEQGDAHSTPLASCHCTYPYGNFSNFSGKYNVKEAFMEVNAPILKDMGVRSLNLDAAARATDYSTSGYVTTYKFGLVTQIIDQLSLRAVYSRDIRAPDLQELFSPGTLIAAGVLQNPYPPYTETPNVFNLFGGGNRKLVPEQGTTKTIGLILTPIPSLNISVDWYDIVITQAIDTFGTNTILAQCKAGNAIFCESVIVVGGVLKQVNEGYFNADVDQTSGFDVSADYHVPFMSGALAFHLQSNYTFSETFKALGTTYDFSNCLSFDCNTPSYAQGMPKFRGLASGTYAQGPWSFTLQGRFIGAADLNNAGWGVVDNNGVPFVKYLDVRASFKIGDHFQLYGAVDNLTGTAPPEILFSANIGDPSFTSPIRDDIYDYLGRQYRIGVRAHF